MATTNGNGTTSVVVREPQAPMAPALMGDAEINRTWRIASALSKSRFFKDAYQAEQAFAKMLLGRDLGLSPTQAMIGIHIVEGKPEVSANLQAQFVREYVGPAGDRYDYTVLEHTDEACEIEFRRRGQDDDDWRVIGKERFTMADANRAGLTKPSKSGAPSMYVKYPRNMLFARCMSNGTAFHCPEVNNGHRLYYPGEVAELEPAAAPTPAPDAEATAETRTVDADMPGGDGPEEQITDAEVVDAKSDGGEELLSDAERLELVEAFAAAGFDDMTMFLSAVGVESTDDLTHALAFKLRELLGQQLAKGGASA